MQFLTQYRGLPKQVYLLSASRAVISMGAMFVYPFVSLLMTSRLGYTPQAASFVVVIFSIVSMISTVAGGKLADTVGRKFVFITATLFTICIMTVAGFFAATRWVLICIGGAYVALFAILPTVSAMVLDWTDPTNKTECFSLMYLASNIGGALGPVVAGMLFYSHMPWIFFSMAIFSFITLLLIVFFVRDIHVPVKQHPTKAAGQNHAVVPEGKEKSLPHILLHSPILLIFIFCLGLLTLCYINLDFLLPLQFSALFGLDIGSKYSAMIWTINGIVVVLFTPVLISFTKKYHPLFNIRFASLLYAIGFSLYAFSNNAAVFMLAVLIWTSGEILISTGAGIFIADQMPATHKGRSMALYEFARGLGKVTGPLLTGLLLSRYTYGQVWFFIACVCLIVCAILWRVFRQFRQHE